MSQSAGLVRLTSPQSHLSIGHTTVLILSYGAIHSSSNISTRAVNLTVNPKCWFSHSFEHPMESPQFCALLDPTGSPNFQVRVLFVLIVVCRVLSPKLSFWLQPGAYACVVQDSSRFLVKHNSVYLCEWWFLRQSWSAKKLRVLVGLWSTSQCLCLPLVWATVWCGTST